MARLKTLGFELQSLDANVEMSLGGSASSISTSQAHSGVASFRINAAQERDGGWYTFLASPSNGPYYARAWIYMASYPSYILGGAFGVGNSLSDGTDYNIFGGSGTSEAVGQSFTAAGTVIDSISIAPVIVGSPSDNITLKVTSSLGGSTLGSKTLAASDAVQFGWNFRFASPITITSGVTYYIEITRTGSRSTSNYVALSSSNTNPYAGGTLYTKVSGVWSAVAGDDLVFAVNYDFTDMGLLSFFNTSLGQYGANVTIDYDGKLRLRDAAEALIGSASPALSLGNWHCVELMTDNSVTTVEMCVNGVVIASSNSASTIAVDEFDWVIGATNNEDWNPGGTIETYIDDIAINDGAGSFQNGYPGVDGRVLYLRPNSAGDSNSFATQTGGTSGAGNNYTRVDEVTPNDATDYNGSSTLNEQDLFNVTDSGLLGGETITVVELHGRFRNSVADASAAIKLQLKKVSGGTVQQSAAITPNDVTWRTNKVGSGDPRTAPIVAYQDPDGSAWTKATLDTAQIGYKLTTAPGTAGRRVDVSAIWMVVEYEPEQVNHNADFFLMF